MQLFLKIIQIMIPQLLCAFYASMYKNLLLNFVRISLFSNWGNEISCRELWEDEKQPNFSPVHSRVFFFTQGFHLISSPLRSFLTLIFQRKLYWLEFQTGCYRKFIILHDCKHFPKAMDVIYILANLVVQMNLMCFY